MLVHWKGDDSLQCASLLSGLVSGISEDICRSGLCVVPILSDLSVSVYLGGEHCTISGRRSKPQPDRPKRIIKLNLLFYANSKEMS